MVHKFLIALIFILTSTFGVQAAQKSEKFMFVAMPQNIAEQQFFSAENSKTVEAQTKKMSFLEKILLKKVVKKINKTLTSKGAKLHESVVKAGVTMAGIGLALFLLAIIIASGANAAAVGIIAFLGLLLNLIGVVVAIIGINVK
jgi:inactivated superfamily I helicase